MRSVVVVSLLIVGFAGCMAESPEEPDPEPRGVDRPPAITGPPDPEPTAPGTLDWTVEDYDLGATMVGGPGADHAQYEYESRIGGTLVTPEGDGPFPLAVFLHGQHNPCSNGQGSEGSDCDTPYRNDRGYVYLQEHLASHGIASASILAHEINLQNGAGDTGMWGRGELMLATIDALAATYPDRYDLERIGLMGHSRGGEGAVTAIEVNKGRDAPYALAAAIALAPTDFQFRAAPDVPFLTLAPYCDGDVYSLHGLRQFDQSRFTDASTAKVQLLVMGANHNNYNTMWGKGDEGLQRAGDDAGFGRHQNTHCDLSREDGGGRLTLEDTYAESILHLGGFLRWTLLGDETVGAYFRGTPTPSEACPAGQAPCPDATHISTMAPGRRDLFHAEESGTVGADGVVVPDATVCRFNGCWENVYQSAWLVDQLIATETPLAVSMDPTWNVTDTPLLNVRVGVPTHASPTIAGPPEMSITLHGASDVTIAIDDPALFMPPALPVDPGVGAIGFAYVGGAKVSANAIQVPVPESLVDDLRGITFTFTGPAAVDQVYVADAWFNPVDFPARI